VIDPDEREHSALNRIKEIPPAADVEYKVDLYVSAAPVMASKASGTDVHIKEHKAWLDDLVAPLLKVGYRIRTEVLVFTRLYEEIIKSARKFGADFVFKPLRQHGALKRVFYTSTDWNLIRMCPMPILMVGDQTSVHGKPVIAAVDVGDEDDAHKRLNKVVMEEAQLLSRVLESEVHLVYAYGPAVVASRTAVADPLAYQIARDKYEEELTLARALAAEYGIPDSNVHLREGAPDLVLNEYGEASGASVVVLGTVARKGASGLFIGNTAEAVLERTQMDMFVVKQGDFQSPV
jgi:universal stress protein E